MESGRMGRSVGILILLTAAAAAGELESLYTNVYCLACPIPTNFPTPETQSLARPMEIQWNVR